MAKIRYVNVRITLNELSAHTKKVPEWELGVLQAQWGDNVQVVGDPVIVEGKLPEPRDEFERLAQLYGPKHAETPFVAAVFGNFGPGVNALQDAIVRSAQPIRAVPMEAPAVAAGGTQGTGVNDEGGDDYLDDLSDLAGDVTEDAEAVA